MITDVPLVDGFIGLPPIIDQSHGPKRGTVEWLLSTVQHHADAEADSLVEYERLAESSGDPVVALVMRLILDDEVRHHGLLKRIEASLRDSIEWRHSPAALPTSPAHSSLLRGNLAAVARGLVAEEQSGARIMRELAANEKGISDGLHSILLEMMAMDSEKHARLLRFVQHRLEARAPAEDEPTD